MQNDQREDDGSGAAPGAATDGSCGVVRAMVLAGGLAMPYVQAGAGPPVLLLTDGGSDPANSLFFGELLRQFRVVAPVLGREEEACARGENGEVAPLSLWLRDFLDGLGLARPSIVAHGRFGVPALAFSLADPERVERLVLAFRDAVDPAIPGAAFEDTLSGVSRRVLVLRVGSGSADAGECVPECVADLLRFLTRNLART